jgi:hypothetical protein
MLQIFKEQGEKNSRNSVYQFWRQDNQPKELFSIGFTWQKMNYMPSAGADLQSVSVPSLIIIPDAKIINTMC